MTAGLQVELYRIARFTGSEKAFLYSGTLEIPLMDTNRSPVGECFSRHSPAILQGLRV